jgi:MoaA/NifB/PqqE/SkfB family radical SAM enzyme
MATFIEKARLLQGYLRGDVAYAGPFWVIAVITRRCNLRCVGCRFHSPLLDDQGQEAPREGKDMPLPLFERLCEELEMMGTRSITITGEGEPLLHPSFSEILSTAKTAGLQVTLVTNGTLLEGTVIEHLVKSGLDKLKVSLWAGTPEVYEKMYPGIDPSNFSRIVDSMKLLANLKTRKRSRVPHVVLHHPVNRTNVHTIDSMVDLARVTGCNALSFSPWRTFRGAFDSLSLTQEDEILLRTSLSRIDKRLNSLSIENNIKELEERYDIGSAGWRKLPCYMAWLHARVLTDGNVLACHRSDLSMGNLNEERLRDIWNNPAFRAFRKKASNLEGLESLSGDCDCSFCGYTMNNAEIHRYFRWISPFLPGGKD